MLHDYKGNEPINSGSKSAALDLDGPHTLIPANCTINVNYPNVEFS
ncbi:MAG: hypothetical protein ACLR13_08420 [Acutalibacteraceae bacterium]